MRGNRRPSPGLEAVLAAAPSYCCVSSHVLAAGSHQYLPLTPTLDPSASSSSSPVSFHHTPIISHQSWVPDTRYPLASFLQVHNSTSTPIFAHVSLTLESWTLLWHLGCLHLCPGDAKERQEHKQVTKPSALASQTQGGLWMNLWPAWCCRHGFSQQSN